ncbi:hypothetical protein Purlil1_3859 [Purpureocillium lilacinum]|uniref:Uncharacterized protein n=1 Tax=Purpureocillium lilacinum TaxID=33203 RepID=A0ABR0C755_PURLI|nr:hypothetical protein Purlil1_3859 [Purpureocillium lilacinum]
MVIFEKDMYTLLLSASFMRHEIHGERQNRDTAWHVVVRIPTTRGVDAWKHVQEAVTALCPPSVPLVPPHHATTERPVPALQSPRSPFPFPLSARVSDTCAPVQAAVARPTRGNTRPSLLPDAVPGEEEYERGGGGGGRGRSGPSCLTGTHARNTLALPAFSIFPEHACCHANPSRGGTMCRAMRRRVPTREPERPMGGAASAPLILPCATTLAEESTRRGQGDDERTGARETSERGSTPRNYPSEMAAHNDTIS